jgi:hypothetical protein
MKSFKEKITEITKLLLLNSNDCEEFRSSIIERIFEVKNY